MEFMLTKEDQNTLHFWSMQNLVAKGFILLVAAVGFIIAAIANLSIMYAILAVICILVILIFFNPFTVHFEEIEFNKNKKIKINMRNKNKIFSSQEFDVSQISKFKITDIVISRRKGDVNHAWLLTMKIGEREFDLGKSQHYDVTLMVARKITEYTNVAVVAPE